jgi:hypothetical protein
MITTKERSDEVMAKIEEAIALLKRNYPDGRGGVDELVRRGLIVRLLTKEK